MAEPPHRVHLPGMDDRAWRRGRSPASGRRPIPRRRHRRRGSRATCRSIRRNNGPFPSPSACSPPNRRGRPGPVPRPGSKSPTGGDAQADLQSLGGERFEQTRFRHTSRHGSGRAAGASRRPAATTRRHHQRPGTAARSVRRSGSHGTPLSTIPRSSRPPRRRSTPPATPAPPAAPRRSAPTPSGRRSSPCPAAPRSRRRPGTPSRRRSC